MKVKNFTFKQQNNMKTKDQFYLWFTEKVSEVCKNYYFDCVYDLHEIVAKMHKLNFDQSIDYKNKKAVFYWGLNENGTLLHEDKKEYLVLSRIKGTTENYKFSFDFFESTNFVTIEKL